MIKNFYRDEINLIRSLLEVDDMRCLTLGFMETMIKFILRNGKFEEEWKDNAENTNFPPDFYSDKYNMMIEVMRVNDHEDFNGKNIYYARENLILKDLNKLYPSNTGYAMIVPATHIANDKFNALKTEEDHNIYYYNKQFIKTIEHHIKQIPKYRKNHPNKKLIFFIHDESTSYVELPNCLINRNKIWEDGYFPNTREHFPYLDEKFMTIFKDSDIDMVIWFMPFKMINGRFVEPMAVIFAPKRLSKLHFVNYIHRCIIPGEF